MYIINALGVETELVYLVKVSVLVSLLRAGTCEIGCGSLQPRAQRRVSHLKMTLGPKACWENCKMNSRSALMHAQPHFSWADNVNEG